MLSPSAPLPFQGCLELVKNIMGWGTRISGIGAVSLWVTTVSLATLLVSTVSARPHAARSPVIYDVSSLVRSDSHTITLMGGKTVVLPSLAFSSVHFSDDHPGANWEHPARILFYQSGKLVAEIPVSRPIQGLSKRFKLSPPLTDDWPVFKISSFDGKYRIKSPSSFHALLINGFGDDRHWNDFSYLYRVLTQVYGYLPGNIHVADSNYQESRSDLDNDGIPDIRYGSLMKDIQTLFAQLKEKLTRGDQLLLVVNDHGSIKDGESTIILFDGEMKASEFAMLLGALPSERILSVFEQCFSGGFVRPTVAKGRVSVAASTNTEISWASEDGVFNEFLYQFTSAFGYQKHDGTPVNADIDGGGRVTAREAYSYAVANDKSWESPFLEASKNSNTAFTLGFD